MMNTAPTSVDNSQYKQDRCVRVNVSKRIDKIKIFTSLCLYLFISFSLTAMSPHSLKGIVFFVKVGLYAILIHNQCTTYSRWRLAHPQFGEPARVPARKLNNAVL